MNTQKLHPLIFHQDDWLHVSMIVFGVIEAQDVRCHRILSIPDLQILKGVGKKVSDAIVNEPPLITEYRDVPLTRPQLDVLLKAIGWYEDTFVLNHAVVEKKIGETKMLERYETFTKLTRAVQRASQTHSDQHDR